MTEQETGRMPWRDATLCLGGALLLIVGSLLPLWSRNGITVNAWEGDYLSIGRWLIVVAALGGACSWAVPAWRKHGALRSISAGLGLLQAALVLWQGHKLHAIGLGAWAMLAGALLLLAGRAFWRK
jgi:hypothetical protein